MALINGSPYNDNNTVNNGRFRPALYGTNDADTIDGGTGIDLMYGYAGDDIYVVDSLFDRAIELAGQGRDTVRSSADRYTLGSNLENLELIGNAYEGNGNSLNNNITGNAIANSLNGEGGNDYIDGREGNDNLYGEAGNDTLIGSSGNDYLFGEANNDRLLGGSNNDHLYGGTGNDTLLGDSGQDYLDGYGGGTEFDVLTGGSDADTFVLAHSSTLNSYYLGNGNATITDFSSTQGDRIQVFGSTQNYSLVMSGNNTHILYNNDLIAVVQNVQLNQTNLISAPNLLPPG